MHEDQNLRDVVSKIRIAKRDNEYAVDFQKTINKIESVFGCKIEIEEVNKEEIEKVSDFLDLSGKVIKDNSCYKIKISPIELKMRQNFTLAHELGHIVLGHKFPEDGNILDDPTGNILGRAIQYKAFDSNSVEESEANSFAAALLMPKDLVFKYFPNKEINSIEDIKQAANQFEVSRAAMMVRLNFLNYIF